MQGSRRSRDRRMRSLAWCEVPRSEEHTSELQSQSNLVCRLLLEKKKKTHAPQPPDHRHTPSTTSHSRTPPTRNTYPTTHTGLDSIIAIETAYFNRNIHNRNLAT